MNKPLETIDDQLQEAYLSSNGLTVRVAVLYLETYSRAMLNRSTLVQAGDRALALRLAADDHFEASFKDARSRDIHFHVFRALSDCHEPIVDDVLLVAAFELYAKASILRRGFAVHEVSSPKKLADAQKKKPLHRNTLRAASRRGEDVRFKETTISISVILGDGYSRHYELPTAARSGLMESKKRRNLVHFQTTLSWAVTHELIAFAKHLDRTVPTFPNGKRRAAT